MFILVLVFIETESKCCGVEDIQCLGKMDGMYGLYVTSFECDRPIREIADNWGLFVVILLT